MATEIANGDRITDGKRVGTVSLVYPQSSNPGAYVRWDGGKRQSFMKIAKLTKVTEA